MKRKTLMKSGNGRSGEMEGTLARRLQVQLGQISVAPFHHQVHQSSSSTSSSLSNPPSLFQKLLEQEAAAEANLPSDADADEKDFILSQDFFW